jgi:type 1 glutamine amidotransferase
MADAGLDKRGRSFAIRLVRILDTPVKTGDAPRMRVTPALPLFLSLLVPALAASKPVLQTAPASQAADPKPAARERLLVFSKTAGFRHQSIPDGIKSIREILSDRYDIDASEDAKVFNADNLKRYRAVIFLSTTGDILNDDQQKAFTQFVRAGGGYAGVHAAADTEHTWPWYGDLVGAYFKTHPPVQQSTVKVEDRTHRSTRMLPAEWRRTDEWYVYNRNPRDRVKVLASLDDSTVEGADMGGDHPIAWYHEFEGGRSWYTGGGHTSESYSEDLFRKHLEGGILWAAGAADTAPGGNLEQKPPTPSTAQPPAR